MDNQSSSQFSPLQTTFSGERVGSFSGSVKFLASWLIFILIVSFPYITQAQTGAVIVNGTTNNVPIVNMTVEINSVDQLRTLGNKFTNTQNVPAIIKNVVVNTASGNKTLSATSKFPTALSVNSKLGNSSFNRPFEVTVVKSPPYASSLSIPAFKSNTSVFTSHESPNFLADLANVVSIPNLRTYWSIDGDDVILPGGEPFFKLVYPNQIPLSGFLLLTERFGNSDYDIVALDINGNIIGNSRKIQVRGFQWNTGISNNYDNDQEQFLVLISPSLFQIPNGPLLPPVYGFQLNDLSDSDGKIIFFVNELTPFPDNKTICGPITSSTGTIINIYENDEFNGEILPRDASGIPTATTTAFATNTTSPTFSTTVPAPFTIAANGNLSLANGTIPGVYSLKYKLTENPQTNTVVEETIVTITVTAPTAISVQPLGAIYCVGSSASALTVLGVGTENLTYQWFSNTTNSNTAGTLVGTGSNFTPPTNAPGILYYYAVATSQTCGSAISNEAKVSIQEGPDAGMNGILSICQGTTPTLVQLFDSLQGTPDQGGTWSNVGNIYTYTVTATVPCAEVAISTVTVTSDFVNLPETGGDITVCASEEIQVLTATASTEEGNVLFWYSSEDAVNSIEGLPTWNEIGSITYWAESVSALGCKSARVPVKLTINSCSLSILKTSMTDPNTFKVVGDELIYEIVVTNTGSVTLTDILVVDPLTGLDETILELLPGEANAVTFETSYLVVQDDLNAGRVDNTARASTTIGVGEDAIELLQSDDEMIFASQDPKLELLKDGVFVDGNNDGFAQVGETVVYTFTVTNTGNVTLTDVTITDAKVTVVGDPLASLAPGVSDSGTFTASYVLAQSDIDKGLVSNIAIARAEKPGGNPEDPSDDITDDSSDPTPVTSGVTDPTCVGNCTITEIPQNPKLEILKDGVFKDGNNDGFAQVGEMVVYTFTVTNTGNVTLTNVTITDEKVTVLGGPLASLVPGISNSGAFTASYVLTQADIDAGIVLNIALAKAINPSGNDVTAVSTDPTPVDTPTDPECPTCTETLIPQNADVQIVITDNDVVITEAGQEIVYTIIVTNSGTVTLTNVTVIDTQTGLVINLGTLVPGQSVTIDTDPYPVTQEDVDKGSVTNEASVTGESPNPRDNDPTDTDLVTTPINVMPGITLVKTADKTEVAEVGEVVVYTLTVTNTGNVTLTDVMIKDPLTGFDKNIGTLLPGEVKVETTTYTVKSSDLQSEGALVNTAAVKGTLPDGTAIEDEASVSVGVFLNEIIANDDDFGTHFISFGGILGNILENDRLNGLRPDDLKVDFEFTELDGIIGLLINENGELSLIPGVNEAREYRLKYTLREVVNPSNSDDAIVVFRLLNDQIDLSVTKTSFEAEIFEGDDFEYQITLANIGGTPATDVVLVDDLPNGVTYLNSRVESVSSTQIQVSTPAVTGTRITWNIPFLPADGLVVIRVSVQAGDAGTITNVANVSAEEEDTSALNNQGDDVNQILPFRIPNVITPNQDGDNDTFEVKGLDKFVSNEIVIINRYGDHVLERKAYQNDWDAPGQVAGTYFYILSTVDSSGKAHTFKGWIQVIKD
jgi:gliding motility-associated-like protein/uncharacterized repeat protein (TIGR01451 family)